jgi:predicted alpha/beta hydrolase family esterase
MIENYSFNAKIFILPGLENSGDQHWQTLWEKKYDFSRINQKDWITPVCDEWIETVEQEVSKIGTDNIILVGHSLACATIAFWSAKYNKKIKGALLVAPSDTEAPSYPSGTKGFNPMPVNKLPFPSITITSSNDTFVSVQRAQFFANAWASKFVNIGEAGHINALSGFGPWPEGLTYLKELEK